MSERLLMFSSDCHAGLRTDLYLDYIDPAYRSDLEEFIARERTPTSIDSEGSDSEAAKALRLDYERRAVYATQLDKRIPALEADGFVGEVLFPDGGFGNRIPFSKGFGGVSDYSPEHHAAALRAYNRWLGESLLPGRQVGLALIQLVDIDEAVSEVKRARSLGLLGVMPQWDGFDRPELFAQALAPVWAACELEGLPVHFHSGSGVPTGMNKGGHPASRLVGASESLFWSRRALGQFILGGVLERHSDLRIVFAETWADWIPRTLRYLDWMWSNIGDSELKSLVPLPPTDYWRSQGFMSAHTPSLIETEMRGEIGIDQVGFGTDFPHSGSPWGVSNEFLRATVGAAKVPLDEARKILGENVVRLYGLDLGSLSSIAAKIGPLASEVLRPSDVSDVDAMPTFIQRKVTRPLSSL